MIILVQKIAKVIHKSGMQILHGERNENAVIYHKQTSKNCLKPRKNAQKPAKKHRFVPRETIVDNFLFRVKHMKTKQFLDKQK